MKVYVVGTESGSEPRQSSDTRSQCSGTPRWRSSISRRRRSLSRCRSGSPSRAGSYQWVRLGWGSWPRSWVVWNLSCYMRWCFSATVGFFLGTNLLVRREARGGVARHEQDLHHAAERRHDRRLDDASRTRTGREQVAAQHGQCDVDALFSRVDRAAVRTHAARGTGSPTITRSRSRCRRSRSSRGLNVFGEALAVGALSGFEYVAHTRRRETKDAAGCDRPSDTDRRAGDRGDVGFSGRAAVLAFVAGDRINLMGPIPQVFSIR